MSQTLYPPIGQLINIGSHQIHIHSAGEGSPTVIFESGGASWSMDWHLVQTEVAKFTRVCSYDRAGFGWSEAGPKPRSAAQIASELYALLEAATIPAPYILVGASFGGHPVRMFAKEHPEKVAGIILLDARHEALDKKMPPAWKKMENAGKGMYQFLLFAAKTGLLKTLGKLGGEKAIPPSAMKLPPALRQTYLEIGFQAKFFQSNLDELAAVAESDRRVSAAGPLGDIPLTVIRHGIPDIFAKMPAEQARQAEQAWQELQSNLATLSSNSKMIVAEKSGHGIQTDQPELVVDAIRQMVKRQA